MEGKEFKRRFHEIFACNRGRKFMDGMDEGIKGAGPTIIELKKAECEGIELTAGDLSAKFNVSTAREAVLLNTLEEKGLIQRYKSDTDGRKTFVRLTDLGRKKADDMKNHWEKMLTIALDGISDEDLNVFFDVLSKMAVNVEGDKNNV
ncbi:MAG: winged helix DNA-binding protein [Acholeplasmatales bacterium]|nr:winged helix DNA-binding protein [Acholeplasmatales bacterium]